MPKPLLPYQAGRAAPSRNGDGEHDAPAVPVNRLAERLRALLPRADTRPLTDEEEEGGLMEVAVRTARQVSEDPAVPAPFPLHVFPAKLRELIERGAAVLPCPPDYLGLGALVVASSFIGPGRPLAVRDSWEERAALYGVTVAPPGARKSPALDLMMLPAGEYDRRLAGGHKAAMTEYRARERKAKKARGGFDEDPPPPRQHIVTDTTVEALADVLVANPRGLLVYRDELTGWVNSLNQYKGGKGSDRQFWLSAWSSQDYTVNRKGKTPLRITRPYLSVIGNIPPDMLGELGDRRGREDGFVDRLLFSYPDPVQVKWDARPIDKDGSLGETYNAACLRLAALPDARLTLDRLAQREFIRWFDEHNRKCDGPAGAWAKMDGYCVRLACILHHLHGAYGGADSGVLKCLSAGPVGLASVRGAIALIGYFKNHARRALGTMRAKKDTNPLARLLAYVNNAPQGRVRPRDLISAQIASNADEARGMLLELERVGLGKMQKGRRKDEVWFEVNNITPFDPNSKEE